MEPRGPNRRGDHAHRVLMIIPRYPPELGGAERQAARLAAVLRGRGHEVEVLTTSPDEGPALQWDPDGTPVHRLLGHLSDNIRHRIFALAVCQFLLKDRMRQLLLAGQTQSSWDILHFHMLNSHTILGAPLGKRLGLKTMVKIASAGPKGDVLRHLQPGSAGWLHKRLVTSVLCQSLDRIVALNPAVEDELQSVGVKEDTIVRIPNGIDLKGVQPATVEEKNQQKHKLALGSDPVLLYTGGFRPEKRVPATVEAFSSALAQLPKATLVLVGAGPEEALVRTRVQALGLEDKVRLAGALEPAAVLEHLKAADALVLLSETEGLSNSLLEAMAAGIPAVASDVPGNRVLLTHEQEGLLVPVGHQAEAGEAIARLLGDSALRLKMGQAARARVEKDFSLDSVGAQYEALYDALVGMEAVASP